VSGPDWGLVAAETLQRIVVVSPHFDDAALGAADVLLSYPGSTVVTVCAGRPVRYPAEPTDWDSAGGFVAGDDVVGVRRVEDRAAMAVLGAEPLWLDFVDWQYLARDERPRPEVVADALEGALHAVEPTAVFLPMGIANPDHVTAFDAGRLVRDRMPDVAWFCFEDAGYKHIPGLLAWRISGLFRSGLWPTPAVVPVMPRPDRKRAAVECYRSQLAPLERDHALRERLDAHVPEQYWHLAPPPPGWERLSESE
jgi:LmbE family N-acetylglucosaminyl deacetylase